MNGTYKGCNIGTIPEHFFILMVCVCVDFTRPYITWKFQRGKVHRLVGGHCGIQWLYRVRTLTSNLVGLINISPSKNLSVGFVHVKEH